MKQLDKILGGIESFLGVLFLVGMVIVVFLQVVLRSVVGTALNWSEEVARYLMIWCTGFGISICVRTGANIGIQAIVDALPKKVGYWVRLLCEILTLAILALLAYASYLFMMTAVQSGQLTPSLQIPIWIIYAALPVSFAFCVVRQVQVIMIHYVYHEELVPVAEESQPADSDVKSEKEGVDV